MNITISPEFAAAIVAVLVSSMGTAIMSAWRASRAVRKLGIATPRIADVTVIAKRLDVVSARLDTTEARLIKAYESIDLLEDENTLVRKQLSAVLIENAGLKQELAGLHAENDAQRLEMATLRKQIDERDDTIVILRGKVAQLEGQMRTMQTPPATGETKA